MADRFSISTDQMAAQKRATSVRSTTSACSTTSATKRTKRQVTVHAILSLLDLPFVLGGAVVWTASFLVILAIGIILLWLVQVIFFFVV